MKTIFKVLTYIYFILSFFAGAIVAMLGIEYFMIMNSKEVWPVLINMTPEGNKIIVALALINTGLLSASKILKLFDGGLRKYL
jgi:hypothetical protein